MKAYELKCPGCGAKLSGSRSAPKCTYCGTDVVIESSHGARNEADRPPPIDASRAQEPAAGVSASRLVAVFALIGVASIVLLIALKAALSDHGGSTQVGEVTSTPRQLAARSPAPTKAKARTLKWQSDVPLWLPTDETTGDSTFVGATVDQDGHVRLAALDTETGALRWHSGPLTSLPNRGEPTLYLADQTILVAGGAGLLSAHSVRDGGELWAIRLTDEVTTISHVTESVPISDSGSSAARTDGEVIVETKDENTQRVSLTTGAILGAFDGASEDLAVYPRTDETTERLETVSGFAIASRMQVRLPRFDGFDDKFFLYARDASFWLLLGEREKGTDVPMLLRYEMPIEVDPVDVDREASEPREIWRNVLPASDPLRTALPSGMDPMLHADDEVCVACYRRTDEGAHDLRMSGFDMSDGRRLWDEKLPGEDPMSSITVHEGRVFVVRWWGFSVLNARTGALEYTFKSITY